MQNYAVVKATASNAKVWAVVKANAYGHGALAVAKTLSAADGYAVSTLNEALSLRANGIDKPILLLEGITDSEHVLQLNDARLETVVHSFEQITHFLVQPPTQQTRIWLKVDSGMHRLGFSVDDLVDARKQLISIESIQIVGVMTHLACADNLKEAEITDAQLNLFNQCITPQDQVSIANSAAILQWPKTHADWVRPGIMLYGATPIEDKPAKQLGLSAVMQLLSPVIAIHEIKQGQAIGYGHRWRATRDSIIATLAIGYGDGYPRHAPDGTPVWLNGSRVCVVGRVSMDMLMVDITDLDCVSIGDVAEMWGNNLPVDEVASWVGTIGYELLTRISPRVPQELI